MLHWKLCLGMLALAGLVACGRPQTEPWPDRVNQALADRLAKLPDALHQDYREGFANGAAMIHEALLAGARPYRPVLDLPTPPPRFRGPEPEGVKFEEPKLAREVDFATGLLLHSANSNRSSAFGRGQVDGFDWALAAMGKNLVHPAPALGSPVEWIPWKDHQEGEALNSGDWTVALHWNPGELAWSRMERGFPSLRSWRPWESSEPPTWVGIGNGAFWIETQGGLAIALDLESGGILDVRPAEPHPLSKKATWEAELGRRKEETLREFKSPEFQRGLDVLRKAAASGKVADLMAVTERLRGMGEEADLEAYGWYLKAAEAGNPEAMLRVGVSLFHGKPVPGDKVVARQWMERAIRAGEPHAAAVLKMLFEGEVLPPPSNSQR